MAGLVFNLSPQFRITLFMTFGHKERIIAKSSCTRGLFKNASFSSPRKMSNDRAVLG